MAKETWTEKYRPNSIDDIICQDEVKILLNKTLETGELPHLIFCGPNGCGKTTMVIALARQLFKSKISSCVLELNASNDRGINVVRNEILQFAKSSICTGMPYKLIILDEVDSMTSEAQSALRKIVEITSKITRFCFICNNINKIIEPIVSRCVRIQFDKISEDGTKKYLKMITKAEDINITDKEIYSLIWKLTNGDLRKATILLQNLSYVYKLNKTITKEDVYNLSNSVHDEYINKIFTKCISDIDTNDIINLVTKIINNGYDIASIIKILVISIYDSKLNDYQKSLINLKISYTDKKLFDGSNEFVQLLDLFMYINGIATNKINNEPLISV